MNCSKYSTQYALCKHGGTLSFNAQQHCYCFLAFALRCYETLTVSWLPTLRDSLSFPSSQVNCPPTPSNIPEDRRPQIHRGVFLKSRKLSWYIMLYSKAMITRSLDGTSRLHVPARRHKPEKGPRNLTCTSTKKFCQLRKNW